MSARQLSWQQHVGPPGGSPNPQAVLPRECWPVLKLMADGLTDAEIAERVFLSQRSTKHRVAFIVKHLGARNRTQAVSLAYRRHYLNVAEMAPEVILKAVAEALNITMPTPPLRRQSGRTT